MTTPTLSVQVLLYHDKEAKYLPYLFHSLEQQTFRDFEIILIENGPTEHVYADALKRAKALGVSVQEVRLEKNLGFANGHNAGYQKGTGKYVLLQNPDMVLTPSAYEDMVAFLDRHEQTGAVSARLMRLDFERVQAATEAGNNIKEAIEIGKTNDIDTIGIRLLRNRRAVDWLTQYEWTADSENKDISAMYGKEAREVFAVSGAFPMYRRSVIEQVLVRGNMFDPLYESYKEDLDLGYRMRNAGFTSYALLDTVAYHDRTGAGPKALSDKAALKNKATHSYYVQVHSYKNHILTLIKNEYLQNFIKDFFPIMWYELKKSVYYFFFAPKVFWVSWGMIIKHIPELLRARKDVIASQKMNWQGLRRWIRSS
jgi:GT2 family glycosyltransferase